MFRYLNDVISLLSTHILCVYIGSFTVIPWLVDRFFLYIYRFFFFFFIVVVVYTSDHWHNTQFINEMPIRSSSVKWWVWFKYWTMSIKWSFQIEMLMNEMSKRFNDLMRRSLSTNLHIIFWCCRCLFCPFVCFHSTPFVFERNQNYYWLLW